MNLLIAFVILLCLGMGDLRAPEPTDQVGLRLLLLVVLAVMVPGVALFQTVIVARNCRGRSFAEETRQQMLRRLSACHTAVWLAASLAIVWSVQWPEIVRVNFQLGAWPLIDDLLILTPILLSLAFSWAIFYDVQQVSQMAGEPDLEPTPETPPANALHRFPSQKGSEQNRFWFRFLALSEQQRGGFAIVERFRFVALRFRVYVLMSLVPLLVIFLARDAALVAERLPPLYQYLTSLVGGALLLAVFPLLMLAVWENHGVRDDLLRSRLVGCCRRLKLGVWQVRVWNTGHQIINAFVAGVVPGLRVIAISDRMVELFPERELLAVVRHEAGHVRLCHVPIRMLFMVLPLVLAATDQANGSAVTTQVAAWLERGAFAWLPPVAWAAVAYVSYLLPMLAWLSRRLEFEADWFSALTEQRDTVGERVHVAAGLDRENQPLDDELAQHNGMTLAIARLAAHSPEQYDRRTIMHPSLRERLQAVASIDVEAAVAGGDLSSMVRQRERLIYGATIVIFVAVVGGFVVA